MKTHIEYTDESILLYYCPRWVDYYYNNDKFKGDCVLHGIFHINSDDVLTEHSEALDNEYFVCKIGYFDGEQYVIPARIFGGDYSLKMDPGSTLEYSNFVTNENGHPINDLLNVVGSDVVIGNGEGKISKDLLLDAKKHYPTKAELRHYTDYRISSVLSSELELKKDYEKIYWKFVEKKLDGVNQFGIPDISEVELQKYTLLYSELDDMLKTSGTYNETYWQKKIAEILRLIFPQYIFVTRETCIGKVGGHGKRPDFLLIDSTGYVDLLEIKVPETPLLASTKVRNNYVPAKQVSDTATQLEFYLYCLNRHAANDLENKLTERFKEHLPKDLHLKILNPRGFIITGRSKDLNDDQISTVEIIRRQYSHIIDILTYDDLLNRLQNTIDQLKRGVVLE